MTKRLDLSKTKVTGAGLTGFNAPKLEQLVLRVCNDLTYSGLMDLLANNTEHLYELDLFACEKIAGDISSIRGRLPSNVQVFDLQL